MFSSTSVLSSYGRIYVSTIWILIILYISDLWGYSSSQVSKPSLQTYVNILSWCNNNGPYLCLITVILHRVWDFCLCSNYTILYPWISIYGDIDAFIGWMNEIMSGFYMWLWLSQLNVHTHTLFSYQLWKTNIWLNYTMEDTKFILVFPLHEEYIQAYTGPGSYSR